MSLKSENYGNNLPSRSIRSATFNGISGFIDNLEKHFFSQISVWTNTIIDNQAKLIIEIECNLSLIDMIIHSYKGTWGTFNQTKYSLSEELVQLEEYNGISFDVEEFTINLKDTSIIIDKLYDQSIADQLNGILNNLEKHFLQLTKGNVEVPYEIFVAVFEDEIMATKNSNVKNKGTQDYSSYWALYFESEKDAVIYDLKNARFIYEDLHMINQ
ncbi:hypothetical protein R3X28_07145 [Maribacter sp. TH_r10]|uniref:Uncharacterized protein n=1 Tax=Maribacter luteus TaxID=2594478 RepID=A0A6I2MQ20_9FLAO|nr:MULTISPECIES: hypothetical protein [Maribacter]MDV7138645.1 hypothetical protein [Maribacter sp. TH_r10]MRX65983.1 hypothetical protein [Maribacter luteus]